MAKIVISGDAVVVTSDLKLEEIRTVEKYRPEELVLKGGEDSKEAIFAIGTTNGDGNINAVGASFGRTSHDDSERASITMLIDDKEIGNVKEYVADRLGSAIANLNKLEERLPVVLEEIKAEKDNVMRNITIA